MQKAVYPGTFDPITFGHCDVIVRAVSKICDHLVIGVTDNVKKQSLFSCAERVEMISEDIRALGLDDSVTVLPFVGLLTEFVRAQKACIVVRGLRAVSDFEYEFQMASANSKLDPNMETIFLTAAEDHHFVASSVVREIASFGGDVQKFVSDNVARRIKAKMNV